MRTEFSDLRWGASPNVHDDDPHGMAEHDGDLPPSMVARIVQRVLDGPARLEDAWGECGDPDVAPWGSPWRGPGFMGDRL